jgi:predicted RNase H-like HicB family nuclease
MVVAEVLDFPGVLSQGFDLADARLMIASALEDIVQVHLEEGRALPIPNPDATAADADLIELVSSTRAFAKDKTEAGSRLDAPPLCDLL